MGLPRMLIRTDGRGSTARPRELAIRWTASDPRRRRPRYRESIERAAAGRRRPRRGRPSCRGATSWVRPRPAPRRSRPGQRSPTSCPWGAPTPAPATRTRASRRSTRASGYKVGNAAIERIATGFRWAEGPVWFGDGGYLLWSDIPNNRIMRWLEEDGHVSVFRTPSNYSNGNTRDREGRLITCEHDARRVTRTEPDGTHHRAHRQLRGQAAERAERRGGGLRRRGLVHRPGLRHPRQLRGPQGRARAAAQRLPARPGAPGGRRWSPTASTSRTGSAFSPDEKRLYIVDSGDHARRAARTCASST